MSGIFADLAQVRAPASWPAWSSPPWSSPARSSPARSRTTLPGGPAATHGTASGPHRDTGAVDGMTLEATAGYHRFLSGRVRLGVGIENCHGRPPELHGRPHDNRC